MRICVLFIDKLKFGGLGGDVFYMEDYDVLFGFYKSNYINYIF